MATNLTAKQIKTWKKNVNASISTKLITSLKKAHDSAAQLMKITATGQDENDLSYRFTDLAKLLTTSTNQLDKFMKSFNTEIDKYVDETTKSEAETAEKLRKQIDQFREAATKISNNVKNSSKFEEFFTSSRYREISYF